MIHPRTIAVGDEVNFTVVNDPNNVQKQIAIRIQHLEPGTVKFDLVIAKDVSGTGVKVRSTIYKRIIQGGPSASGKIYVDIEFKVPSLA